MADVEPLIGRLDQHAEQLRAMHEVPTSLDTRLQPMNDPAAVGNSRMDPVDSPVAGRLDLVDKPLVGRLDPVDKPMTGRLAPVEQPAMRPTAMLESVSAPMKSLNAPVASQARG